MKKITIIDTGCANLSSLKFALQRLGYKPTISALYDEIINADKLLLPGVGNAKTAMMNLEKKDLIETIKNLTIPILGICLGMQLFTEYSEESDVNCLNIIKAKTKKIQETSLPLPHMGWNQVNIINADHPLFIDIKNNSFFYFVHSYAVDITVNTTASCQYSSAFSAALCAKNFYGVQFHPERSSNVGMKLLQNFIENT